MKKWVNTEAQNHGTYIAQTLVGDKEIRFNLPKSLPNYKRMRRKAIT
jgi:hypothetical protein